MALVYQFMLEHGTSERALEFFQFDVPRDVEVISIWRGFVRDIAEAMQIKKHLIDQAVTNLCYVESVRRIYRGSHGHPSVFYLIEPPENNKFMQLQELSHRTGRYHTLTPEQRLNDSITRLVNRVVVLEAKVERLEHGKKNDAVHPPRW